MSKLLTNMKTAHTKAEYDKACKTILSSKEILSKLLKYILEEFEDLESEYIRDYCIEGNVSNDIPVHQNEGDFIIGMNSENITLDEGKVNFDIVFYAKIPKQEAVKIIINIEAQKSTTPYPIIKRGIYYASRLISSQYGREFTKSHYEKIKKVYSIWICLNTAKKRHNTIAKYGIMKSDIVGYFKERKSTYDLINIIIINIGHPKEDNYEGIIKMLGTLLKSKIEFEEKKSILRGEFSINLNENEENEVKNMCNLSDVIFEDGINEGLEIGIQQGIQQGIILSIINIMKSQQINIKKAMDMLCIPVSEQPQYQKLINEMS